MFSGNPNFQETAINRSFGRKVAGLLGFPTIGVFPVFGAPGLRRCLGLLREGPVLHGLAATGELL